MVGSVLLLATLRLPWRDDEFTLSAWLRVAMAAAGLALLVCVARREKGPTGGVVPAIGILGTATLLYPSVLTLSAAEAGGPLVTFLAGPFHVIPLTLVQLLPVLAGSHAVRRTHRRWEACILAVAIVGVALTGIGLAGGPAAPTLLALSLVLWFGSFLIAPIVTWSTIRGTHGEPRRRVVVAAVASLVPVIIIGWCLTLAPIGAALGIGAGIGVSALMAGMSIAVLTCGALCLGAIAPTGSPLLRTRAVTLTLNLMIGVLCLIVGSVATLAVAAADVPTGAAVAAGTAITIAIGLPWLRLHAWTRRVVNPAAELRHALAALGEPTNGQRQAVLHVVRRLVGDPDLEIRYLVEPGTWVGESGEVRDPQPAARPVTLARDDAGTAVIEAYPTSDSAATRVWALGDCAALLRPALLETRVAFASRRADAAAAAERQRLTQDLHDGLQGRLLGLALNLQLSGRELEDPAARLLVEDAVGSLRDAVDEVRALGGGRIPEILAVGGLAEALPALLRPIGSLVELELPAQRFDARVEAAAYFVISEAVTNALKHADADHIGVRVTRSGETSLAIKVRDNGRGGADPRLGSGLRGIAERVAAIHGTLLVHDDSPRGTLVEAVLPCGS